MRGECGRRGSTRLSRQTTLRLACAVAAVATGALIAPTLRANNAYTSTNVAGYWSNAGTWVSNTVPASGIDTELDFGGAGADANTFIDDIGTGSFTLNEIQLNSTSTGIQTIAGNTTSNTLTFASNSLAAAPQILQNGSGAFVISNGFVLNNTLTFGGAGTGSVRLTGPISGAGGLTLNGRYTLTLTGNSTYTGATVIGAGVLDLNAATGSLGTSNITFNGTGTFLYENDGATAKHTQGINLITFASGEGTVEVDYRAQQIIAMIPQQDLGHRTAGATGNFVVHGTANTSQAEIVPINMPTRFIDQGTFYNGSNYAWIDDSSSVMEGIPYGLSNTGAVTTAGGASVSGTYVQTTGPITAQATATFTTLNLASNASFTLTGGATLTVNGILKSGNVAGGATIAGGAGIRAGAGGVELVIRTDGANDAMTINPPILNNGGNPLTKSGLGTLTFGGVNTYTGVTTLNAGAVNFAGNSGSSGGGDLVVGGTAGIATLNVATTGTLTFNSVSVGGIPGAASSPGGGGAINQSVGTFNYSGGLLLGAGAAGIAGAPNGGYGAYTLSGGTLMPDGGTGDVVVGSMGLGNFMQAAGSFALGGHWVIGDGGTGIATLTSGTTTGAAGFGVILGNQTAGAGTLNLGTLAGGNPTLVGQSSAGLQLAGGASTAGLLNLNAGTLTLSAGTIHKGAGTSAVLNWNGGTLQAAAGGLTLLDNTLDAVNVLNGGAVVDTQGFNATIAAPLIGAGGKGIYPSGGTLSVPAGGAGYIGAPLVTVSGGSGVGATAIANVVNGSITGVTLTSPGENYQPGDVLTFTFAGGGAATPALPTQYALQLADVQLNSAGGLKKLGSGALVLTGASTYTGATNIVAGTLEVDGSLGDTQVSVMPGAALAGKGAIANTGANAVMVSGTIAPGDAATYATLTTGPMTWAAGGAYAWKVGQLPSGSSSLGAGVNWDNLIVSSLSVTAGGTPGAQFTIAPIGNPSGIQSGHTYTWQIAQIGPAGGAGGPVGGFDPAQFVLDTSQFAGGAYPASDFAVANNGSEVDVVFTPAPEPSSLMLIGAAASTGLMRRRRRQRGNDK